MPLQEELQKDVSFYQSNARISYWIAYTLNVVAVVSSFVAGLSVAADWFTKTTLVVLSSLPAGVLIASDRLKFEQRAAWHYRMTYALQGLLREVSYEGKAEAEVSAERRKIDDTLQPLWPGFGGPPTTP